MSVSEEARAAGLVGCKRCGEAHCSWVKSKRSGKWYLADARYDKPHVGYSGNGPYRTGGLMVRAYKFHVCGHCPVLDPDCVGSKMSLGEAEAIRGKR